MSKTTDLSSLSKEELVAWIQDNAKLWLAHDGLWFQSVEKKHGMREAIEHDKNAWSIFSPLEAKRIKQRLNLDDNSGLEGLKQALNSRIYALLNKQEIIEETGDSFIFRMAECRVQAARERKGLEDFPCKEVGIIEYTTFAKTIDERVECECIGCPPDDHPGSWHCAWKFTIK